MTVWRNSRVEVATYEYEAEEWPCEVKIDEREIVVAYEDGDGPIMYRGKNDGSGHFLLKGVDRRGKASLHGWPKSKRLVGYWEEEGYSGFWRILLR